MRECIFCCKQLFLSQPTVSNELKHLEKTLGYSLFYRLPRKMELTPEGKFLFDLVSDPVKQLIEAESKAIAVSDEGSVFVGFNNGAADMILSILAERFKQNYPQISFITSFTTRNTLSTALENGSIDCSFVLRPDMGLPRKSSPGGNISHINAYYLQTFNDVIIAGDKYRILADQQLSAKELHNHCLLFQQNVKPDLDHDTMYINYKDTFGQSDEEFNNNIVIGDSLSLANLVTAGIGLGVLPDFIADHLISIYPDKLFKLNCSDFSSKSELILLYSNYKKPSRQAMRFIRFLLEECQFSAREISVAI